MIKTLSEIVGSPNLYDSSPQTARYSVDGMAPRRVLFPGNIEEVCQILACAGQEKKSITPRGSGTKMGWGRIPSRVDWMLCTERLNQITDCDYENLTVTVEAGAPLSKVQRLLKGIGRGYFVPLDPSFSHIATIGGVVATNSSGPKRYLYGTPRDLILGLKTILPNGYQNVWGGKTVKNVAGYDMSKLYIGSFGTLGFISEVVFRILPLPEREATLVGLFKEASAAFKAVSEIIQSELLPSAVEVLSSRVIGAQGFLPFSKRDDIVLAVNFEGFDESVHRQIGQLKGMIGLSRPCSLHLLEGPPQEAFWTGDRNFESSPPPSFPGSLSCRVTVPISKSEAAFSLLKEMADRMGLDGVLRCHAGSGVVYLDTPVDDSDPRMDDWVRALAELRENVKALEGCMVIQKAPLSLKRRVDVWGTPGKEVALMRSLKAKFDPGAMLNPGRFVGGI